MKPETLFKLFANFIYLLGASAHIWTVYIAFTEGGFFAGVLSLFLPVLSEIYWIFKMFGDNNLYSISIIIISVIVLFFTPLLNESR